MILEVSLATDLFPPTLRLALTTGVMGGFTTYSTFNYEPLQLSSSRRTGYSGAPTSWPRSILCLVAGGLGVMAGRFLAGS
jgi:fluoride exporter